MSSIFPFLTGPTEEETSYVLAPCTEWAYDYDNECLEIIDGRMRLLTGLSALKVWIFKAAKTELNRHPIYSALFGSELATLIGQNAAGEDVLAEAEFMLTEALSASPYITAVSDVAAQAGTDDRLLITATVETLYGPFQAEVQI